MDSGDWACWLFNLLITVLIILLVVTINILTTGGS